MSKKAKLLSYMVWMTASIFYAYQYVLRVMPNIMLKDIMAKFDIDAATFGQFSGVYYIGYSLMHIPIGIALDKYCPKRVMSACILMTVLGSLPMIMSNNWEYLVFGRFFVGVGSSAAILGTFKIIRMTFNEHLFARMLSISVTIGVLGGIYGGAPVNYMVEAYGAEFVVEFFAYIGVALACVVYLTVPNIKGTAGSSPVMKDIISVLTNKRVLFFCIFSGLMIGPLEGFADVWGKTFLEYVYGFEPAISSSLPSIMFIGMCFGGPLLSLISEKTNGYVSTIVGSAIIMATCLFVVILYTLSATYISVLFFIIGICCGYQIIAIYKISTCVHESHSGLATALANMIMMIFGYCFHSTIGYVVAVFGGTTSIIALKYGIAVIPIALIISAFGFIITEFLSNKKGSSL